MISIRNLVLTFAVGVITIPLAISPAYCEEKFEDLLKRAQEFKEQGQFSKAMSELSWANKQLEKLHGEKLQTFFPASAADFQGGAFSSQNALGLVTIDREYKNAAGTALKVSLSGAASTGGAAETGMGALAGLAGLSAAFGGGQGMDSVRVKGNRAILDSSGSEPKLTMPMSSGMILSVEPQSGGKVTKEQLTAVAEAFDTEAMEKYVTAK